ncbi:MAG: beta-galactosidase [Actinomycetota bacterium]|nr:beta-galactosidase [Actinomycetota bacterium]
MGSDEAVLSRREVLRAGVLGGAAFALSPGAARAAGRVQASPKPSAGNAATYDFNQGWRFGGSYVNGSQEPGHSEQGYAQVTVPHTVTPLSWGGWSPNTWERVWIYRKHFSGRALTGGRVFLDFDGVMTDATVYLNGIEMTQHQGGFLPWSVELTGVLIPGDNVLAVVVDGRWLQVPPEGNPGGPGNIDYLVPAGIYRDVTLRVVPDAFISDVFAKPTNVLSGAPGLEAEVTVDASKAQPGRVQLTVELLDHSRKVAERSVKVRVGKGITVIRVALTAIPGVTLWSPDTPKLYTVRTTLTGKSTPSHTLTVKTGFRQATFTVNGFFLNGQRLQIFGLNRHQLYPYTGMAAPARLQARDAELIRNELHCNMVRCSHYPQSPHFLDACDQVGLMVWEEPPGWQYIGDPHSFQALVLENVRDMVMRDRSRPSVIVWGTRINETSNDYQQLYAEARALAYHLDGTRQTTGAMAIQSTAGWSEDVFAYDDYHTSKGDAILQPPVPGIPYMISEAVGSLEGQPLYRWIDSSQTLGTQARLHAQVHDIARSGPAYSGLLAWGTVDYASLSGGNRIWQNLKWGGVLDTFRVPKPGATFYRSQVDPAVTPVILPAFYWDFGPSSPVGGPGANAMIATNCQALQINLNGQLLLTGTPDITNYGSVAYPPVFVDLTVDGTTLPTLRIDGYIAGKLVTSLSMSSNPATDHLGVVLEDPSIVADGIDATRFTFRALDAYGNQRPYVSGRVALSLKGPAQLVAQNPFDFAGYGGVGGAHIRSLAGRTGVVTVTASHPTLGQASASLRVTAAGGRYL